MNTDYRCRPLGQQHADTGPDWLDSDNGPIIREIHEDGSLTCTQGDVVMRTEAYDLDRAYAYQRRLQLSEGLEVAGQDRKAGVQR